MATDSGGGTAPVLRFALLGWPEAEPTLRLDYRAFSYAGKFAMSNTGTAVLRTVDGSDPAPGWEPDRNLPDAVDPATFTRDVAAAVAFNADRTDPDVLWLRYVTVHVARRGEGLGPRLVGALLGPVAQRGYERVRIAVNNPFAYEALYKAGFSFTGRETGIAELVLERAVGDADRQERGSGTSRAEQEASRAEQEASRVEQEAPRAEQEAPRAEQGAPRAEQEVYQEGLDRYRDRSADGLSEAELAFLDARKGAAPPEVTFGRRT